jgi:hypothetical protein
MSLSEREIESLAAELADIFKLERDGELTQVAGDQKFRCGRARARPRRN